MKKLPFTKEQYDQMLDAKLTGQGTTPNPAIEALKQAAQKLKGKIA